MRSRSCFSKRELRLSGIDHIGVPGNIRWFELPMFNVAVPMWSQISNNNIFWRAWTCSSFFTKPKSTPRPPSFRLVSTFTPSLHGQRSQYGLQRIGTRMGIEQSLGMHQMRYWEWNSAITSWIAYVCVYLCSYVTWIWNLLNKSCLNPGIHSLFALLSQATPPPGRNCSSTWSLDWSPIKAPFMCSPFALGSFNRTTTSAIVR